MKAARVLLLSLAVTGCAHTGWRENQAFALQDSDWEMIAGNALNLIERYGAISHVVLSPGLDRRAVAALKKLRPVAASNEVERNGGRAVPAGYFLVEAFTIDAEGAAMFEGDLGPTGCPSGCGRNFSVPYVLRGNDWYNPSLKIVDYSIRRDVIPVDESR
jgi:hypothetical protein